MSRLKNFTRNVFASYMQLAVNMVYSLASVPLILHWLPKAEFGMWALLVQMMSYITMVDLGMTAAAARLLVDHKDDRANGNYGALVKTAFLVSAIQGGLILTITSLTAPLLATLMNIPAEYVHIFILLIRFQGIITAFSFSFRPLSMMLYAHQRMDIQALNDAGSLLISLGLLLLFLIKGCGVFSFLYTNAICALIGPIFLTWNCHRLHLLPRIQECGAASGKFFKEIFAYGTSVFLFSLGVQLQMASQTIIISRLLGLEAAAIWSIGTKAFNLAAPLMWRPNGAALPGLYEMQARGENERLKNRFRLVVLLTASLGAFFAVSLASCNSLFVQIWMNGKIAWPVLNDILLGTWLFLLSLQTTHCNFVNVTKQIGGMRYILFSEGCGFIILTVIIGRHGGIAGIISCSIFCTLIFSYQYSLRRSCAFFHCRWKDLALEWVKPSFKLLLIYALLALVVWWAIAGLPTLWRLAIQVGFDTIVGGVLLLRFGLPHEMILKVRPRLPRLANALLQLIIH
jgi:O-antigen/teichoic acid export membrane protein